MKLAVEFVFEVSGGDGNINGGGFLSSSLMSSSKEQEAEPGCRRYSSEDGFISTTAAYKLK